VLDPALQDGKKIPKWSPQAQQGMYMGVSTQHSSLIGMILNLSTGHVSPQYHVVHDDLFTTVPSANTKSVDTNMSKTVWQSLMEYGHERMYDDDDENGATLQELDDEWLTPLKREAKDERRQLQRERMCRAQSDRYELQRETREPTTQPKSPLTNQPGTETDMSAPEGDPPPQSTAPDNITAPPL
jgi:hypothetical protein